MLVNGYGATIGAHHLSGICALMTDAYTRARAGELVGLYTMTRFKGEGVGARLVTRVLTDARTAGLAYVFACTTEERAQVFFERQGFRRVGPDEVPAAKWDAYDPQRKAQLAVFRFDLPPAGG
jgi:amino-acid N-acetyltransferase